MKVIDGSTSDSTVSVVIENQSGDRIEIKCERYSLQKGELEELGLSDVKDASILVPHILQANDRGQMPIGVFSDGDHIHLLNLTEEQYFGFRLACARKCGMPEGYEREYGPKLNNKVGVFNSEDEYKEYKKDKQGMEQSKVDYLKLVSGGNSTKH